jgi:hypothetical protein
MPSMANITVQNAAAGSVVYTAATASAGDRSPAVWRATAASAIIGHRPRFQLSTRDNSRQNGRVFEASFSFPIVESIGGIDTVTAKVPLQVSGTLPTNVDSADVEDAFVQFGNLLVSTLIRASAAEGYAPT